MVCETLRILSILFFLSVKIPYLLVHILVIAFKVYFITRWYKNMERGGGERKIVEPREIEIENEEIKKLRIDQPIWTK